MGVAEGFPDGEGESLADEVAEGARVVVAVVGTRMKIHLAVAALSAVITPEAMILFWISRSVDLAFTEKFSRLLK